MINPSSSSQSSQSLPAFLQQTSNLQLTQTSQAGWFVTGWCLIQVAITLSHGVTCWLLHLQLTGEAASSCQFTPDSNPRATGREKMLAAILATSSYQFTCIVSQRLWTLILTLLAAVCSIAALVLWDGLATPGTIFTFLILTSFALMLHNGTWDQTSIFVCSTSDKTILYLWTTTCILDVINKFKHK